MRLSEDEYHRILSMAKSKLGFLKKKGGFLKDSKIMPIIEETISFCGITCDEEDKKRLLADIEYEEQITHTIEAFVFNEYEINKWYSNETVKENYFWSRYKQYLIDNSSIDENSIKKLCETTLPDIMNCLNDPNVVVEGQRLKRGLIIGDVQSGKTATYTGLICKAADAGYKVVILLAGITESLRQQTQERIDEGVIGYTIRKENNKEISYNVGVGKDNKRRKATSFTSCVKDFVQGSHLISTTLAEHNSLVLFVVKKNVSVLNKLYSWLREHNMDTVTQCIDHPMLLIDDEADNASINTRNQDTDPSKTNEIIRKICDLFKTSNYVGFTATPFANVFIDPDSVDRMKREDLFPKDFIYSLPTPSSYIGAQKLFFEDGEYHKNLIHIADIEEPDYSSDEYRDNCNSNVDELNSGPFYYKHNKEWNGIVPDSLREAVYTFYLANVVRDLRGDSLKPRSMLVNMSRFVKVQNVLKNHIDEIQQDFIKNIRFGFDEDSSKNTERPLYQELKRIWFARFDNIHDVSFCDVISKKNLLRAIYNEDSLTPRIEILLINGSSANKLDYKAKPSLRVIAVGGLALSRGLTLEGLLVSYFYRNTSTFDVLMQMGRWFGYRKGYDDLFRVWTSYQSASWYREIEDATVELKNDIRTMFEQHLSPKDFGIRVRNYSDELQITASNKMRASYDMLVMESYYGNIYDTPYVSRNADLNHQNLLAVKKMVNNLLGKGYTLAFANRDKIAKADSSKYFSNVPKDIVVEFLSQINCSAYNSKFNTENLIDFVSDPANSGLENWDIVFEGGDGNVYYDIPQLESIRCASRTIQDHNNAIQISSRRRVLSLREGKFCLTAAQIEEAENKCRVHWKQEDSEASESSINNRSIPVKAYFEFLADRNPVLIIMLIQPMKPHDEDANRRSVQFMEDLKGETIVSFAAGFPGVRDLGKSRRYKANKVYHRMMFQEPDEIEYDE